VDARFSEVGHVFEPEWIVKTAKSMIIAFVSALRLVTPTGALCSRQIYLVTSCTLQIEPQFSQVRCLCMKSGLPPAIRAR
jgi:hypothetical protein